MQYIRVAQVFPLHPVRQEHLAMQAPGALQATLQAPFTQAGLQ